MLDIAQKAYNAFLDKQKSLDYKFDIMTKEQQDAEMLSYTTLKIAASQESVKNENFMKSRAAAFAALEVEYNDKRSALAVEWQLKEDALV